MTAPELFQFANDAFYLAFRQRDYAAMDALWARDCPVTCVHPGWAPLVGRDAVMESWEAILGNEEQPTELLVYGGMVFEHGSLTNVLCYERLGDNWMVATNSFVMEAGEARIVHHHASHCMEAPDVDTETAAPVWQ